MKKSISSILIYGCYVIMVCAAVPTAEEYAHALEAQFTNGASAASIRARFETNELYSIYEILPFCYDYAVDTNDLEESVSRYQAKIAFIEAIMPKGLIEVSSNVIERTSVQLNKEYWKLRRSIRERYEENPTPENRAYWEGVYPMAFAFLYSGPAEKAFTIHDARAYTKNVRDYFHGTMSYRPRNSYGNILNFDSYPITREELYAELSTNAQYNADAMFKYCLTEKSDFATNNIAIAEKQIWRNNFVLDIVRHSCNLHTNETNRALNIAYTNRLAILRAYYDAIPEPHLGMTGAELDEWRARLGNTIDAYTNGISPFRSPEQGD